MKLCNIWKATRTRISVWFPSHLRKNRRLHWGYAKTNIHRWKQSILSDLWITLTIFYKDYVFGNNFLAPLTQNLLTEELQLLHKIIHATKNESDPGSGRRDEWTMAARPGNPIYRTERTERTNEDGRRAWSTRVLCQSDCGAPKYWFFKDFFFK